jgi:exopolyphosphatase/pppGpp-phosphohydrolase
MRKRIGVIDIGNLKVKLEIVEVKQGKVVSLYASNTLTCLGLRMNENNNRPWRENLKKTIEELKRCRRILGEHGIDETRVVSTHALREMGATGVKVAKKIEKEAGLRVEIISQKEEAELFFKAVTHRWPGEEELTIVDVGSGSVQVLLGNRKKLKQDHLLKMGAQYLHDTFSPRHGGGDSPTEEEILRMRRYILQHLACLPAGIKTPVVYGSSCIINLFQALKLDNPAPVRQLERVLRKVAPMPYDEREKKYPFEQKYYMWGVDKALLIVTQLARRVAAPWVIPTNANINQGLILGLVER